MTAQTQNVFLGNIPFMDISQIWLSQRKLYRSEQIPAMIQVLTEGRFLSKIILIRCEDKEIQLKDGHHRLVAIWKTGRRDLYKHEYLLLEGSPHCNRCGKIESIA
jgi:hypothetical protein